MRKRNCVIVALVVLLLLPIGLAGCGSEMATGTVLGAAGVGTLDGVLEFYKAESANAVANLNAAQERLKSAELRLASIADESEKQALQAEIDSLKTETTELKSEVAESTAKKEIVEKSKEIVSTDWSTPAGAASGGALISNLLTVWYFNKKKKGSDT